jgi:hypothetical protein
LRGTSRRNGKPTSLGCFDEEEQAARAYDKMMIWCELHRAQGIKPGVPNFPSEDYEKDMAFLQSVNQVFHLYIWKSGHDNGAGMSSSFE